MESFFVPIVIFLVGLATGSFLAAAAYRLPRGQSLLYPPSTCPQCQTRLTARDLVPVLSHLAAGGRCRHCGAAVSWRYTAVEFMMAAGYVAAYYLTAHWPTFGVAVLLFSLTLLSACIDLEHMILPDVLNGLGALAGIGLAAGGHSLISLADALWGALLGFSVVATVVIASKGGMGMGDAKFLAMLGTFVGPWGAAYTLIVASVIGAVVGGLLIWTGRHERRAPLPFGPFLSVAAWAVWVYLLKMV